jgi:hypothetical protein
MLFEDVDKDLVARGEA